MYRAVSPQEGQQGLTHLGLLLPCSLPTTGDGRHTINSCQQMMLTNYFFKLKNRILGQLMCVCSVLQLSLTLCRLHELQPARLLCPRDFLG